MIEIKFKKTYFAFILFSAMAICAGAYFSMEIFKNDFEKQWEVLFNDVTKLNEYTSIHPVELRDVTVEGHDIAGAVFTGATFTSVDWTDVDASNAILTKVVFKKCKFTGGKWGRSTLSEVVFEDCEFMDTSLSGSIMTNVRFKNCKIERTGIGYLKGGKVKFDGCFWDTGAGGDSSCEFHFSHCTLDGISFSVMKGGVPITFEDCVLEEIDFYQSHFSDVVLRRVTQGEGPTRFNSVIADTISFEDVDMTRGVSLAYMTAKSVRISGGTFRGATEGATIAKLTARDATLPLFDMSESQMAFVSISNCQMYDIALWDCVVDEYSVTNSTIDIIRGKNFKADTVVWDNVTLDGKIDLTNAQVKDFRPTRLKRGPKLQLITTGSNMRFN